MDANEVRDRADIVDVIGDLVPLKRRGKEYWGCCPFHDERTPSFRVVPAESVFRCPGCGLEGDVFAFVMKRLGMDRDRAVRYVAVRSGVEMREAHN